ncbi:MAG: SRPBCC domain-containing protein [Myxococcota bacterium]
MPSRSLVPLALLCGTLVVAGACRPYDPGRDRKIPRPPKTVVFEYEAVLDAPIDVVWATLTDLPSYEAWNPWITRAEGPLEVGERVDITVQLGDDDRDMWHRVVEVEAPTRFCWRDGGPSTGFVTGLRCRTLTATADGRTRIEQVLTLGGSMRAMAERRYGPKLMAGMEAETTALGEEAQRRAKASPG